MIGDMETELIDEDDTQRLPKIKSKSKKIKPSFDWNRGIDYSKYDSKMLAEPIIIKETFTHSLSQEIRKKDMDKINLKLLDYATLKEIIIKCGSYPEKTRKYIWKFLLSLPSNAQLFTFYTRKGIHSFFKYLNEMYPVYDQKYAKKLQCILSVIAHWSPYVGNVYFLPNLVFPFIKAIPGDDMFIFELVIAFINSFCEYWFEYYPGAPLNHIKICEKILENEALQLCGYIKELQEQTGSVRMKLSEIIWRMMKNLFSESLIKDHWLQLMDFLLTFNHKPEILLYFACAYLIKQENVIMKSNVDEIDSVLFGINSNLNLHSVFTLTLSLFKKYSKYQTYKYKPYIPFPENEYPVLDKFPLDFIQTTSNIREEIVKTDAQFESKEHAVNLIKKKYIELLKSEKDIQATYECLINKEKEKSEMLKKELDLLILENRELFNA